MTFCVPTECVHTAKVEEDENGEQYIMLSLELMAELGWEPGDEIEVSTAEICEGWGEHMGLTLANLTKNGNSPMERGE